MNLDQIAIPGWGFAVLGLYLLALFGLGWLGHRAKESNTLQDHFLGGRRLGFGVLLLTLFATQYSGNTLVGYAGTAYRSGFAFFVAVPFMMAVIGVYLLYAPRLYRLARRQNFLTPADYVQHRFQHRGLTVAVALAGIIALANYLITNLKAIGAVTEAMSGGQASLPVAIGCFAFVILIYELLGGLRSVAWSDVLQGIMLLLGCLLIFGFTIARLNGDHQVSLAEQLFIARPDFWVPPAWDANLRWVSTIAIVAFGAAMYPHAIQRIYAAKSEAVLQRSLKLMVFLPLLTTLLMVALGILGNLTHPGLDRAASEGVVFLILGDVLSANFGGQLVAVLFLAAVLAAIMSSADSALLSIASSVTQDLVRPLTNMTNQARLTCVGKLFSTGIMLLCVLLAIALPQSIWELIEIKTELLAQTAPAIIGGLSARRWRGDTVLAGFLAGTGLTLFLLLGSHFGAELIVARPWGIHAGLWGLFLNIGTIALLQTIPRRPSGESN